tara:strand:- start:5441 stop:5614 length:174 start_codon:yes stop_codon:yes gene_type:complete
MRERAMKIQLKKEDVKAPRNFVAMNVRDPNGNFRPTTQKDKTKYNRKVKHKKEVAND